MANHFKTAMVIAILTLKQRGWSDRRITREAGSDRETVARYVHLG
jgi:transcriptional regulator